MIRKREFIKKIEKKVLKTIGDYNLIKKSDRILVACSGGKDSTTLLYILNKYFPNIGAITIDALIGSYSKENLKNVKKFCKENKIKLYVVSFRKEFGYSLCYLRDILNSKGIKIGSCVVCGVLRRYLLNKYAKKLKKDVIATGHNLDDEAQSVFMNLLRNDLYSLARLGPKTGVIKAKGFVTRVKPLYFCSEKEMERFSKLMKFPVKYGICPCSVHVYRRQIGNLLNKAEEKSSKVKENIINYFLKIMPNLKKKYKTDKKLGFCSKCGEPARGNVCKVCEIIGKLE